MRPGQLTPTEFEAAILEQLVKQEPRLRLACKNLHVLSREYTGIGCFTRFHVDKSLKGDRTVISLGGKIEMPGVPNGMGTVLFCDGVQPRQLETYTYGSERWDGAHDGFTIKQADKT